MNIKNELEAMNERMFTDELLDKILAAHRNELVNTGFETGEQSCAETEQAEVCSEIQFYARRLCWF